MKPTNATLNSILAGREFFTADLYQITLNNVAKTALYYAQGQTNITFGGNTYLAGGQTGPYFDRKDNKAKVTWRLGVGNDQLVIDVVPGTAALINGVPWLQAAFSGFLDGADFQLSRAFMTVYGTVQAGCGVLLFRGRIAEVDADRSLLTLTVNDYRELLNQQLPRNLFAASCANTLGDASCTVNLNSFSAAGTVRSGSSTTQINTTVGQGNGYWGNGKIIWSSGFMNGFSYGVSDSISGSPDELLLTAPLPFTPLVGDTFTVFAGCDRSNGAGGCLKFSNIANFRGFPYVPAPELAL